MENSAYVPGAGHMSSPALVVFSQAAGGLTEALRIQRPFNPQLQLTDATSKDLHRPFTATGLSLRHMEAYNSLPAHLLHHLQPQFLHPSLSLGSGAFRPLADLKTFPSPSAFGPPKCLKIETGNEPGMLNNSHGHNIFSPNEERFTASQNSRPDSCSPASVSLSPTPPILPPPATNVNQVKEESLDAHMSEDGDGNQTPGPSNCEPPDPNQVHEENRGFRLGPLFGANAGCGTTGTSFASGGYSFSVPSHGPGTTSVPPDAHTQHVKNNFLLDNGRLIYTHNSILGRDYSKAVKKKRDPSCCPVCGMTVSSGELETHFLHELERLYKLSTNSSMNKTRLHETLRPPAHPGDSGPDGRWETFQRIKTNRQGRLRIKMRKRKADDSCPMCVNRAHRSPDDHGEQCGSVGNDEDETVDVEGDSEFEEWPSSQHRLQAGPGATPFNATMTATNNSTSTREIENNHNESEDLIVDGDEPEDSVQFEQTEIENPTDDGSKEQRNKLFTILNCSPDGVQSQVATSSGDVEVKVESGQHCDSNVSTSDAEPSSRAQVLEDLKSRIRQLEAETTGDATTSSDNEDFKCLICLEHYKKPVISTVCWHVHCEECWLHILGTKKVCPQCNMIITPADLRRIFM